MKPDFSFRLPKIFGPIFAFFAKNFAKMGPIIFGGLNEKCLFFRDESNGDKIKALSPLFQILIFCPIFAPRPHMGNIVRMDPKPPSKDWDVSWPSPSTHILKQKFPK